jgi:glutathione S-transferase
MKLYEFAPTRSIRARWTLQELGVDFEAVTVDLRAGENRRPEFLAINPAGKLPVLVDGDRVITESVAIVLYLAEKYPQRRLFPSDPAGRAEAFRWLLFVATELEQPLWRIARNTAIYPEADRQPSDVAIARRDFGDMVPVLEEHMRDREFVVGDHATVVDFVTAYTLDWANMVDLLDQAPRLRAYMERMYARPKAALRIKEAFATLDGGRATAATAG